MPQLPRRFKPFRDIMTRDEIDRMEAFSGCEGRQADDPPRPTCGSTTSSRSRWETSFDLAGRRTFGYSANGAGAGTSRCHCSCSTAWSPT